ncbi:MAG: DUF2191 domain-containing protein [Actinomycetota bacterium]|nr:DUF2191 domain-containing protein [Actinomycetota bacterium]
MTLGSPALTIDDDVAAQLGQLRARADRPFREIVNEVLRAGLSQLERSEHTRPRGPYTRAVSLGSARLPDVDDVSGALAIAEGDDYR